MHFSLNRLHPAMNSLSSEPGNPCCGRELMLSHDNKSNLLREEIWCIPAGKAQRFGHSLNASVFKEVSLPNACS
uniref:Uncharacterized protein n=1 Tax=Arundo donax TaxID=35708 RepID=A0A0A8ZWF4_ARUDO